MYGNKTKGEVRDGMKKEAKEKGSYIKQNGKGK